MKDFLGREIAVGDQIVYTTRSGSFLGLVHARVLEVRENGSLRVQPLHTPYARGEFHYVDSRTGEDIPDKEIDNHVLQKQGWVHRETGEYIEKLHYMSVKYNYQPRKLLPYVTTRRDPAKPVVLGTPRYVTKLEPFVDDAG